MPTPARVRLLTGNGAEVVCRCEIALLNPATEDMPAMLWCRLLRHGPAPNQFEVLNQQIEVLKREVARRQTAGGRREQHPVKPVAAELGAPLVWVAGNHDERTALRNAFPEPAFDYLRAHPDFVQYTVNLGGLRLIALDTVIPRQGGGRMCAERLAWLFRTAQPDGHRHPLLLPVACLRGRAHVYEGHGLAVMTQAVRGLVMLAASPRFVRADDWAAGMEASVFRNFASELGRDYRGTLDRFLMLEAQGSDHVREELRLLRTEVFAHGEPGADAGPPIWLCDPTAK